MKPRVSQLTPSTTAGDVLKTVDTGGGVMEAQWSAASPPAPLFSDDTGDPLVAEDGSDFLYPDS